MALLSTKQSHLLREKKMIFARYDSERKSPSIFVDFRRQRKSFFRVRRSDHGDSILSCAVLCWWWDRPWKSVSAPPRSRRLVVFSATEWYQGPLNVNYFFFFFVETPILSQNRNIMIRRTYHALSRKEINRGLGITRGDQILTTRAGTNYMSGQLTAVKIWLPWENFGDDFGCLGYGI